MANCPNCGAELAPSVLSCANCRTPLPRGGAQPSGTGPAPAAPPGQPPSPSWEESYWRSDDTVIRPAVQSDSTVEGHLPPPEPPWSTTAAAAPEPEQLDPRAERQRRNTVTLVVLAAILMVIALVSGLVVLTSMGGDTTAGEPAPPAAPTTVPASQASPAPSPSTQDTTSTPSASTPTPTPTATPTPEKGPTTTPADAKNCGSGLQVPAKGTSCEFAQEVRKQVASADPEAEEFSVQAHSPVTKKDYTMECVRNSVLITCTGGNNAVVWIHNGG